jgi:hypothetical protein
VADEIDNPFFQFSIFVGRVFLVSGCLASAQGKHAGIVVEDDLIAQPTAKKTARLLMPKLMVLGLNINIITILTREFIMILDGVFISTLTPPVLGG